MKQLFKKSNVALLFVLAFIILFTPSVVRVEALVANFVDQGDGGSGSGSTGTITLTVDIDNVKYLPGATVSAAASSRVNTCSNVTSSVHVTATLLTAGGRSLSSVKTVIPRQNVTGGTLLAGDSTFTAPSMDGQYLVQFIAYRYLNSTSTNPISKAIMEVSFTVEAPNPLTIQVFADTVNPLNLSAPKDVMISVKTNKDANICRFGIGDGKKTDIPGDYNQGQIKNLGIVSIADSKTVNVICEIVAGSTATPSMCDSIFPTAYIYSSNQGGTYLGTGETVCWAKADEFSCNSFQASPGGQDPLQNICTWAGPSSYIEPVYYNPKDGGLCQSSDPGCISGIEQAQ